MADKEASNPQEEFFILDSQNEGVKVDLYRPDGTKSDHWVQIRGHFSDEFQNARRRMLSVSKAKATAQLPADQIEKEIQKKQTELTAVLIMDWSFDIECNEKNKVDFLTKAPQIAAMVDKVAAEQALFMRGSGGSSKSGSPKKSNSSSRRPAQRKRSKTT